MRFEFHDRLIGSSQPLANIFVFRRSRLWAGDIDSRTPDFSAYPIF